MSNISLISDCFGCGVCAIACPKKIISIRLNKDGFYVPYIDKPEACIDCGICLDVCAFNHKQLATVNQEIKSYAAWSKEDNIRKACSSGGVGFEVSKFLISEGYKVCSVKYNPESQRAEHYIASTIEELIPSIGSKYIQSYTLDAFKLIDRKQKYLIIGTPCQIDSFRRYIQKYRIEDNFILMDFFCHGVPSMWSWKKYLQIVEKKIGPVTYASWRNKLTGWHDSWAMALDCKNNLGAEKFIDPQECVYYSRLSAGDLFYKLFLGHYCMGQQCYKDCKYKYDNTSADVRIGDLWGNTYKDNDEGVSAAISFTERGNQVLMHCNCEFVEHPFEVVAEGQMKKNCEKAPLRRIMLNVLKVKRENLKEIKFVILLSRIINRIKRVLK